MSCTWNLGGCYPRSRMVCHIAALLVLLALVLFSCTVSAAPSVHKSMEDALRAAGIDPAQLRDQQRGDEL